MTENYDPSPSQLDANQSHEDQDTLLTEMATKLERALAAVPNSSGALDNPYGDGTAGYENEPERNGYDSPVAPQNDETGLSAGVTVNAEAHQGHSPGVLERGEFSATASTDEFGMSVPSEALDATSVGSRPHDPGLEHRMQQLANRIADHAPILRGEEAIRLAIILPMIRAFGYDVFDPQEVQPGEEVLDNQMHVDFRIAGQEGGRIAISYTPFPTDTGSRTAEHLRRLLVADSAQVGILTNGTSASFFRREIGDVPWKALLSVNLCAGRVSEALHALTKAAWNPEVFFVLADTGNQVEAAYEAILAELEDPGEDILAAIERRLRRNGIEIDNRTFGVIEEQFARIRDLVVAGAAAEAHILSSSAPIAQEDEDGDKRDMTPDESVAFEKIKLISSSVVDPERIFARPAQSYVAVLLDDNNRQTIARIHYQARRTKYVGTFVGREETRNPVQDHAEIDELADKITARVLELDK